AGKTVLLNLWATWCAPCRAEMPALDALQKEKGGNTFEVVAVNVDTGDDAKPKKFLKEIGIETLGYYRDATMGLFN
ncbi:MAG: TlpA family protein disulfide reductase, partial [Mesorhizobium sp.]